jgi:MurNAc alpha-1-phosphate uridylyltransferase
MPKAIVLAAGFGTRMRPLTDHLPKPLIAVAGITLLDRALDWLAASGVEQAIVNSHYKAELLEAHLAGRIHPHIAISREDTVLETGGGILQALPWLGQEMFIAVNGDVICLDGKTPALQRLQQHWGGETMDALLLVHPVAISGWRAAEHCAAAWTPPPRLTCLPASSCCTHACSRALPAAHFHSIRYITAR